MVIFHNGCCRKNVMSQNGHVSKWSCLIMVTVGKMSCLKMVMSQNGCCRKKEMSQSGLVANKACLIMLPVVK